MDHLTDDEYGCIKVAELLKSVLAQVAAECERKAAELRRIAKQIRR